MKKYLLIILLALILFFALTGVAQAIETIVKDYPEIPGAVKPGKAAPGEELPQFIKYIFMFSLGIVGLIGMVAIIMGAFGYITSAGNPQAAANAKSQIFSALLGLLLLLGSWVLLNLVNPDLLRLGVKLEKAVVTVTEEEERKGKSVSLSGSTEEGCRFLQASWDKGKINAGDKATLTFHLKEECKDIKIETTEKTQGWHLYQYSKDAIANKCEKKYCSEPSLIKSELKVVIQCTFDKKCGACRGAINPIICNDSVEKAELFYVEGWIKTSEDGKKQSIPRLELTVKDLKTDGTCCQ